MTERSIHTDGGAAVEGDLVNTGTFIGRDQIIVLTGYSGEQLEQVLARLQAILGQGQADLKADLHHRRLTITAPGAPQMTLSSEAAGALSQVAARQNDERAYLASILVHPRYGRWAEQFVPLAGTMTVFERPPGWVEVEPEFCSLEVSGEGPGRQIRRVRLDDITQATAQYEALALLGEPGAGKTTTLFKLALDAARARLLKREGKLPLLCALADFGPGYEEPHAFVEAVWRQKLGGAADLTGCLRDGQLLLLCDALNEMPFADGRDYRARVGAWRRFVEAWPGNQVLFTCRSRDYGEPLGLHQVEIEPLDDERVHDFVIKYVGPIDEALARSTWTRLRESPLLALARNPYYLKMLVYLILDGGGWPEHRAGLFDGFVRILMGREERRQHPDWPGAQALCAALSALAYRMQPIGEGTRLPRPQALESLPARLPGPDGPLDVLPATVLRLGLAATLLDTELAPGGEERVRFYHHQLQEYFSAREMVARFRAGEPLDAHWRQPRLVGEMPDPGPLGDDEPLPPPPTTGWEEPTVLAAALAPDPAAWVEAVRRVNPVLAARCLSEGGLDRADLRERVQSDLLREMGDARVHLRARIAAGEALGALGDPRFRRVEVSGQAVLLPPLVHFSKGRFEIGSTRWHVFWLARRRFPAGDERPRHAVETPEFWIGRFPVTNAEYACFVRAGGYDQERYWQTEGARAWLRGELTESGAVKEWMDVWRALKSDPSLLDRRDITSRQRAQFQQLLSMEEAQVQALLSQTYGDRKRDRPAYWEDGRYNNPAQPVVGVCWFEAGAYCAWLQEQIRSLSGDGLAVLLSPDGQLAAGAEAGFDSSSVHPSSVVVRLPSEAEWERAARGGQGRVYPWGDRWDATRANTWEGHVLRPSPVGVYPTGVNAAGLHDLSGNVWEWTRSLYRPYPYDPHDGRESAEGADARVLRGGSWGSSGRLARCAFRLRRVVPDYWDPNFGFRVSLSLAFAVS